MAQLCWTHLAGLPPNSIHRTRTNVQHEQGSEHNKCSGEHKHQHKPHSHPNTNTNTTQTHVRATQTRTQHEHALRRQACSPAKPMRSLHSAPLRYKQKRLQHPARTANETQHPTQTANTTEHHPNTEHRARPNKQPNTFRFRTPDTTPNTNTCFPNTEQRYSAALAFSELFLRYLIQVINVQEANKSSVS